MALGRHPMVPADRYSAVPSPEIPRSAFDNRWFHKTTMTAGLLCPVFLKEVLPGDSIRVHMSALFRLATPVVPVMDNLALESFWFFVPNRLVWDHWEEFMGEQDNPASPVQYLVPTVPVVNADCGPGSQCDYFGITVNGSGNTINVNSLPFRGYNLIYNEWFRDQGLGAKATVPKGDGPDGMGTFGLFFINKPHDYFTSARPWPMANSGADQTPFGTGGTGEVGDPLAPGQRFSQLARGNNTFNQVAIPVSGIGLETVEVGVAGPKTIKEAGARRPSWGNWHGNSNLLVAMSGAGSASGDYPLISVFVNDLRMGMAIQTMLERDARGGSRYVEKIWNHFKVRSPDARLQRPEFLGHGKTMITVNPVAQTTPDAVAGAVYNKATVFGQLSGTAYFAATDHGFSQSFTEHGYVFGIIATRSDLTYQQGIHRHWMRRTSNDFYVPALANLGEQAILSREVYCDGAAGDADVFGYQMRWDEYRTELSRTSGYFRSTVGTPLDMWHFGQKFTVRPSLGLSFVQDATPMTRVLQTTAPYTAQLLGDIMFEQRLARAMPMFSIPGVGGRL